MLSAFATCPKGLEELLHEELQGLGGENIRRSLAGVGFDGSLTTLYRACLWSRLANRVLLALTEFPLESPDDLYTGVNEIQWDEHLSPQHTFAVGFTGTNDAIRQTNFGALKTKDAIVDWFRIHAGQRPSVDTRRPDVRVHVNLRRGHATVSIDLSGGSLHRRGYRPIGGIAPLKENLAAAVLVRAGWPALASRGGCLIDPLCGSGTLLVEAAQMAMGIAPGLLREQWGFTHWKGHQTSIFESLTLEARDKRDAALDTEWPPVIGYDKSDEAINGAKLNIELAGLSRFIQLKCQTLNHLNAPPHHAKPAGLVVANPPYGERLNDEAGLTPLYTLLGEKLRAHYQGWQAALLTGNPGLGKTMGIRAVKQYQLFNGTIPSKLLLFDIKEDTYVSAASSGVAPRPRLSPGAQMFANRLQKNWKHLDKWRRRLGVNCYRLYDADIPEYSVAVDVYNDWVHVAEYKAPHSVDPATAEHRLREVLSAIPDVLAVAPGKIVVKQRERQRGPAQYQKRSTASKRIEVQEADAKLLVNLHDYLDTGLFLDHRRLRLELGGLTSGKRFLNLFCYTASATVHAALGGANASTSIDLSSTYIDWARNNFAINHIDAKRHRLVKADCLQWLAGNTDRFDVIVLDPPTFSNSKSMRETFDVERDHPQLIDTSMQTLNDNGLLIFSSNRRTLTLQDTLPGKYQVKDMTAWSLDRDYTRKHPPHRCWFIRHRTGAS